MSLDANKLDIVKGIVCRTLEIEPDELRADGNFAEVYDADSLRMIEVLAGLERDLAVKIDQSELANMTDFNAVIEVLKRHISVSAA